MGNSKNLPAIYNPRACALVTVGEVFTPHKKFVAEVQEKFPHPHDLINAGINPFKAYREDYGETRYNVADVLDCDVHDYKLMEEGEVDISVDDILHFCQNFNIQPYDLIPNVKQDIDVAMLDAMLQVHDNPSILSTSNEDTYFKIEMRLSDEVLPVRSVYKIQKIRNQFNDSSVYSLTVAFLDELIAKDGSMQTGFIDNISDVLGAFIDEAAMRLPASDKIKSSLDAQKDKAWKDYNALGSRLYRENWKEMCQRLWIYKKIVKSNSKLCDRYEKSPSVLGEDRWPSHGGTITHDGRHMNWMQAKRRHVIALRRYFDLQIKISCFKSQYKNTRNQITALEVWAKANQSLLMKYQNRQKLMHHHDFRAYRPKNNYDRHAFAPQFFKKPANGLKADNPEIITSCPKLKAWFK